jgi:hypothetical protein
MIAEASSTGSDSKRRPRRHLSFFLFLLSFFLFPLVNHLASFGISCPFLTKEGDKDKDKLRLRAAIVAQVVRLLVSLGNQPAEHATIAEHITLA